MIFDDEKKSMFCYDRGFSNRLKHDSFSEFLFHNNVQQQWFGSWKFII